jgi:hypothetical protein
MGLAKQVAYKGEIGNLKIVAVLESQYHDTGTRTKREFSLKDR